ncbi:type II secretion system F family protein [Stenotrophomonas maltophilia]|uniref:type II secretion system F family protein n=1 Tax=Stenotrophomonas maltophilia TaxID=40324 RepID=UPI00066C1079|nr:type II secretion system F family protein [Stenotrophomonas maltophilia]
MVLLSPALSDKLVRLQVTTSVRAQLYEEISAMIQNGKSLNETLSKAYEVTCQYGAGAGSARAQFIYELKQAAAAGKKFSGALKRWAPPMETTLIAVGEGTGDLVKAFENVRFMHESEGEITSTFVTKVPYPVALFVATVGMLWMLADQQVPQMLAIAPQEAWSGPAGLMIHLAQATQAYSVPVGAAIVLGVIAVAVSLPRWTGSLRHRFDRFGPWAVYRRVQGSQFLLSYATLVNAGVSQDRALEQLIGEASPYLHERLSAARLGIARGRSFGEALRKAEYDFPDPEANAYIEMMSDLDGFAPALLDYSKRWMKRTVKRVGSVLNAFFFASILGVASIAALTAVSSFQMTEVAKKIQR